MKKVALVVGNEHAGLSDTALKLVDRGIVIPMRGITQSLNVSVATAVALGEITRQRETAGMDSYLLSKIEQEQLVRAYLER